MHSFQVLVSSPLTRILTLLLATLFLASLGNHGTALASPISSSQSTAISSLLPREDSDYPTDDEINKAFTGVGKDESVFFSQTGDSQYAYNFAQDNSKKIFRDVYPKKYTIKNGRSDKWYQDFADRFSRVFAEKSSGDVYFVSIWSGSSIDECRVWNRVEYPALTGNSDVTSIILVDYSNSKNQKVIWTPSGVLKPRDLADESHALASRSVSQCFDWDGTGEDPADPDKSAAAEGFYPGWCGVHVTQYQKNEADTNPTANYKLDITVKDAANEQVGAVTKADAPGGQGVGVTGRLPLVLTVTAQSVDGDAVLFAYGGQNWGSNDQAHQCNFGSYDSGKRDGDCGFTC